MKFSKYLLILAACMLTYTSCDEGFQELNVDPTASPTIDPGFQISWVQLRTSGGRYENWRAGLIYSSMMVQHMAAVCGYWTGDKYTYNAGYSSSLFDRAYTEQVKDIQDLIATLEKGEIGDQTMLGMARIWRVVIFHRLTDLYGDIPYSEAGKGFLEEIYFPKYDPQSAIYADMLNELEQAVAQLSSGGFGTADLIYRGDVDKWKKFGNSLMLRLGMRLSEVDAAASEAWVKKAIAGGVMTSNDDIAFLAHTNGPEGVNMNGIGEVLDKAVGFGDDCPRLSKTLVDWMLDTGDPRLDILGELPADGSGVHNGLPNGLDETTIMDNPTGTSTDAFDRVNQDLVRVSSPMVFQSYAEVALLLAEAAERGWDTGNAEDYYNDGIRAAMQQFSLYADNGVAAVADDAIDQYLSDNPYDGELSTIGWQYWAATFLNEYEAFANWRRTGFPELTPTNHPSNVTNGTIPVRLAYPQGELNFNPNFDEALSRQNLGTDFANMLTVPVWWDQ